MELDGIFGTKYANWSIFLNDFLKKFLDFGLWKPQMETSPPPTHPSTNHFIFTPIIWPQVSLTTLKTCLYETWWQSKQIGNTRYQPSSQWLSMPTNILHWKYHRKCYTKYLHFILLGNLFLKRSWSKNTSTCPSYTYFTHHHQDCLHLRTLIFTGLKAACLQYI